MAKPGILTAVAGRARCGKGVAVKADLVHKTASLVWDPKGDREDYPCVVRCFTIPQLAAVMKRLKSGMVCYTGSSRDLDNFVKWAWLFAKKFGARGAVVFDEMASTSGPGKAAGAYGDFLRQSLYIGHDIYVMAQSPAETDKTAFKLAQRFYFTDLGSLPDQEYISIQTRLPLSIVQDMAAHFAADHRNSYYDLCIVMRDQWWEKKRLTLKNNRPAYKDLVKKTALSKK